jgi:hypothetical protein
VSRRYAYIDRSGVYHRCDEEGTGPKRSDYFRGVAPSDLGRLDARQLYLASERLHESVVSGTGTPEERAGASEALNAVYSERRKRRQTIR